MNRTTSGRSRAFRGQVYVDAGCCNLAAQRALSALYGLSGREAVRQMPETFVALVTVASLLWACFDTPERLARRLLDQIPQHLRKLPPSEVDRADGWRRLMETIRCSRLQTRP